MTPAAVIDALSLPAASLVGQRVPKKLLLENGAPTAADKRLINEGIEELQWLAALKPAVVGAPEFRDGTREYLEIAVLQLTLRATAKAERLVELVHRAVPYPVLLLVAGDDLALSVAHKRQALNEVDKTVVEGEPLTVTSHDAPAEIHQGLLGALALARQPRTSLLAVYQGWVDVLVAYQAARLTGRFCLLDSTERSLARRQALQSIEDLQARIAQLRTDAGKTSQMARQVELNLEVRRALLELDRVSQAL